MDKKRILLAHGSGGKLTHHLIKEVLVSRFGNPILRELKDSGLFNIAKEKVALTTDSYVVNPILFPGGDIGKLSICGTINDLAVCGAKPIFISCAFIIEEGLEEKTLERIADSIKHVSDEAGVKIITGDTKVVEKGACDKIFINTSGIGIVKKGLNLSLDNIKVGDDIIINGSIGDHGISILSKREELSFKVGVKSDCAPLNDLIFKTLKASPNIKFMRDPTRGGVATTLNEIIEAQSFGMMLDERNIPLKGGVRSACELLGMDPLYIGNEGKVIMISSPRHTKKVLGALRKHKLGKKSRVIGKVIKEHKGKVCLKTKSGGIRLVDMLTGEQLPRIC